uniref:Uncharacterized protein n=1 Tax=Rhizophora mucronata TaxID=61149 RepID=A0A2P2MCB9_RHIMU
MGLNCYLDRSFLSIIHSMPTLLWICLI